MTYDTQLVAYKCSNSDANDISNFRPFEPSIASKDGNEDDGFAKELQLCSTNDEKYLNFELRIIHRKSRLLYPSGISQLQITMAYQIFLLILKKQAQRKNWILKFLKNH